MCVRFFFPISQETGQLGTKHFIGMTLYELNLFSKRSILTHCGKKGYLHFGQLSRLYYTMLLCYVVPMIFHGHTVVDGPYH